MEKYSPPTQTTESRIGRIGRKGPVAPITDSGVMGSKRGQLNRKPPIKGLPRKIEKHLSNCIDTYMQFKDEHKDDEDAVSLELLIMQKNWQGWLERNKLFYDPEKYDMLFMTRIKFFFPQDPVKAEQYYDREMAEYAKKLEEFNKSKEQGKVNATISIEERLKNIGLVRG